MMDKITEALDKRHTERRTKLENLHDQRIREASVNEGTHYFESMFHEKVREIQKNLTNLELGDDHLIATFSKTSQSLQDLQKFLSSSAFYLNDRKVQKCQDMLNELTNNLEERKTVLIPKKKFGFKNRVADATKKNKSSMNTPTVTQILEASLHSCSITDREKERITFSDNESSGKDLSIKCIKSCIVRIRGHPSSLHIKNANNCIIIAGPISRSILIDNCVKSIFVFACQQLRLHNSYNCDIYLQVTSRGIIEDSSNIRFAPFNLEYPDIEKDFEATGIARDKNHWNDIVDFNWLSTEESSPNWSTIPENERINDWPSAIEGSCSSFCQILE